MLRTFYKEEVLLNDSELLYGLLSECINKGLNQAIVQSMVMQVDAFKRPLGGKLDPKLAGPLKANIEKYVGEINYAVEQFEQFWLSHIAWKVILADGLNRAQTILNSQLDDAQKAFNQSALDFQATIKQIDEAFAAKLDKLYSDFVTNNTLNLAENVLGIFQNVTPPLTSADAALQAFQVAAAAAKAAKEIKDAFDSSVNDLQESTAAAHKEKAELIKKARDAFALETTKFNDIALIVAQSKACLEILKNLSTLKLQFKGIPDVIKQILAKYKTILIDLTELAKIEDATEFLNLLKAYIDAIKIAEEGRQLGLLKSHFLETKITPTLPPLKRTPFLFAGFQF